MRARTSLGFVGFVLLLWGMPSPAMSAMISAASCEQIDVQAAIDLAADNDTVSIPAGTCTWTTPAASTPAMRIDGKGITLRGAGNERTVIVNATGTGWNECTIRIDGEAGKPFRITELVFQEQATIEIYGNATGWRIDHVKAENDVTRRKRLIYTHGPTYGVIDSCELINSGVVVEDEGDGSWQRPLSLGTAEAVFIEDCIITLTDTTEASNAVDAVGGARYVFRYNTLYNKYAEAHSGCPSGYRATFSYEIYGNTFIAERQIYRPFLLRGGTGVVYDNTITGSWTSPAIHVDDQRSCLGDGVSECHDPWDRCDGDSIYDGNEDGQSGYPCRDQIGRSTDSGMTTPQLLEPLYEWDNYYEEADVDIIVNPVMCSLSFDHIQENRDYFNDTPRPGYVAYPYPHPVRSAEEEEVDSRSKECGCGLVREGGGSGALVLLFLVAVVAVVSTRRQRRKR